MQLPTPKPMQKRVIPIKLPVSGGPLRRVALIKSKLKK